MTGHPQLPVRGGAPHRFPMLMVDAIEAVSSEHGRACKRICAAEAFVRGGEGPPALAPTLLVDALGQVAIIVLGRADPGERSVWYLASIDQMTFHGPVLAGGLLSMEARIAKRWRTAARVDVAAWADGAPVASGSMVLSQGTDGTK